MAIMDNTELMVPVETTAAHSTRVTVYKVASTIGESQAMHPGIQEKDRLFPKCIIHYHLDFELWLAELVPCRHRKIDIESR